VFNCDNDGYSFIIFFPWAAFFLSHFFLSIKKALKREIGFLVYFLSIIILYFGIAFQSFNLNEIIPLESLLIDTTKNNEDYTNKKILVFGPNINPYFFGKSATSYFNWELSKGQLEQLSYYDNLEAIDKNIRADMPDFIIDQIGLAPKLFDKIPLLGAEYQQTKNGIYKRLKSSN
jgi:hypothetical protein